MKSITVRASSAANLACLMDALVSSAAT